MTRPTSSGKVSFLGTVGVEISLGSSSRVHSTKDSGHQSPTQGSAFLAPNPSGHQSPTHGSSSAPSHQSPTQGSSKDSSHQSPTQGSLFLKKCVTLANARAATPGTRADLARVAGTRGLTETLAMEALAATVKDMA